MTSPSTAPWYKSLAASLQRPTWSGLAWLLAACLCILPFVVFWDELIYPRLKADDFVFLADCRGGHEPLHNLMQPHNAHVVPLFRLLTAGCAIAAGRLHDVPSMLMSANSIALILSMLALGHFVAWETRRHALGLLAMLGFGVSSALFTPVTWYSAGQTLWACWLVLSCLVAVQAWRMRRRLVWMVLGLLAALAAPFVWGGGLVAGLGAAAYLAVSTERGQRRWAGIFALAPLMSIAIAAPFGMASWRGMGSGPRVAPTARLLNTVTHTLQAIPECLVFQNLGLDVATAPVQGVLLTCAIAVLWAISRRSALRPNALEASGLTLIVVPYLMAFALRSNYDYPNLRNLGWYNTLPQAGWMLLLAGWLSGNGLPAPGRPAAPPWGSLMLVAACGLVWFGLHYPRVEKILIESAPPMSDVERNVARIPELQKMRAVFRVSELKERQARALARLQHAGLIAQRLGLSRTTLRRFFGRIKLPGWPVTVEDRDGLDLLALPEQGGPPPPASAMLLLHRDLAAEPVPDFDAMISPYGVTGTRR